MYKKKYRTLEIFAGKTGGFQNSALYLVFSGRKNFLKIPQMDTWVNFYQRGLLHSLHKPQAWRSG
jgi:hypothetical protein